MDITIVGLNKRQRALADILWGMNGREEVDSFINSLRGPTKQEAELVLELMMLSVWDEIDTVDDSVKELIDNCR